MKRGQTSVIFFLANIGTTVLGFFAMIYLTRTVPSAVLGSYFLVVAVLVWVNVTLGRTIQKAVRKRLSESGDGGYVGAGLLIQLVVAAMLVAVLLAFRGRLNAYFRAEATLHLVGLVLASFAFSFVQEVLKGQNDVHIAAVLQPLERGVRSLLQVGAAALGFGLSGLLLGYAVGAVVAALVGLAYVTVRVYRPTREHVVSLLAFARYSWLGMVGSRAFASMDTLVLGLFVAPSYITYYEIAWNVASILAIFGVAIAETLFPEISKLGAEREHDRIRSLMEDAVAYAGLFLIPGLVGAVLVGDRILRVYGPDYAAASTVLVVLVLARIMYAYGSQFSSALDGIDRPDLSFRVDAAFVVLNVAGNLVLVSRFGWLGAATATAGSSVLSLALGYHFFDRTIGISIPYAEIARQVFAAVAMGAVVYGVMAVAGGGVAWTVVLVGVGGAVYFAVLLGISKAFRRTVRRNIPR